MIQRRNLGSSENESRSNRLAKYWSKHPKRFTFPYNSRKFFEEWKKTQGELNIPAFLRAFDFGFVEFGRYVRQNEREARFAGLAEGCLILSSNLFFSSSNLGCGRNINIAIGARGMGGKAAAHFEPHEFVINTTRDAGNHSFAHEYAHAIDLFLGRFYDQSTKFNYLSGGESFSRLDENKGGKLRAVVVSIVREAARQTPVIFKEGVAAYWRRPIEIFARAFEAWVSWVFFITQRDSSYNFTNSFLCKPWSFYQAMPVYPSNMHTLDDKFMVFCLLAGEAMNGRAFSALPSIDNALKAAQSNREQARGRKTKREELTETLALPKGQKKTNSEEWKKTRSLIAHALFLDNSHAWAGSKSNSLIDKNTPILLDSLCSLIIDSKNQSTHIAKVIEIVTECRRMRALLASESALYTRLPGKEARVRKVYAMLKEALQQKKAKK